MFNMSLSNGWASLTVDDAYCGVDYLLDSTYYWASFGIARTGRWLFVEMLQVLIELAFTLPHKVNIGEVKCRQDVEPTSQPAKSMLWERFGENIRFLLIASDESDLQLFMCNFFLNKVKINLNMFHVGMEDRIID